MLIARVHGVLVQVEIWNNLRTVTEIKEKMKVEVAKGTGLKAR